MGIELLVKRAFSRAGLSVQRLPVQAWDNEPEFKQALREIEGVTLVDPIRCYMLYQLARRCRDLPGDAAEFGVYRGGTARLIGKAFAGSNKTLRLFDTFAGMPETDPGKDAHKRGDFSDTSPQAARLTLMDVPNVELHPGFFPDSAAQLMDKTFCFAHVDVDIHRSIAEACKFFYPRLSRGGVMIFDDYGAPTCPGVKAAVDVFFAEAKEHTLYLPTGQCLVFKTR